MPPKAKPKKSPAKKASVPAKKPPAKKEVEPKSKEKSSATTAVVAAGPTFMDPDTGLPLIEISVCASELIPTGEYANVTVGPVRMTKYIRDPQDDDTLVEMINDMCELIEVGVVAEQRELVLQSLQSSAQQEQ